MKKYLGLVGLVVATGVVYQLFPVSTSCAKPCGNPNGHPNQVDKVTQIAPLDYLMNGGYEGPSTVAEVARQADFGIGTFTGLDGEMVMLDGVVYQAPSSGAVRVMPPHARVPFATLTYFRAEHTFTQSAAMADYSTLQAFLNTSMPDKNQILAIKVRGTFNTLKLRAPQKQVQPYPILTEALKTQAIFDFTNVKGTMVGFRFPAYIGTVNSAGYHFHFLSDDRKAGGHVLEVSTASIVASVETVEQYNVTLPISD